MHHLSHPSTIPQRITWPNLPLAVYREIEAHLSQVSGVTVQLLPQTATQFNYDLSQVGGLELQWVEPLTPTAQTQVLQILNYYCDRFGAWQELAAPQ